MEREHGVLGLDSLSWGQCLSVIVITMLMTDDEQDSFHFRDETGAQRGAVTCPGPHSLQAEGLGIQTQDCGSPEPTVPVLLGCTLSAPSTPGSREGLSILGAQCPSPSLHQVPELLCHKSEPHGCDPRPLGSSAAGRRGPQQPGECLGGDGQERDAGGHGHRRGLLSCPKPAGC